MSRSISKVKVIGPLMEDNLQVAGDYLTFIYMLRQKSDPPARSTTL